MLVSYELKLKIDELNNYKIYNWGSLMQGVLLEDIDPNYVEKLHNMKYNPYSQYIYMNEEKEYIWRINTIGEEAYNNILKDNILNKEMVYIKQKDIEINICEKKLVKSININELFRKWFIYDKSNNKIRYRIVTPVSYKIDNRYVIVPDIAIILSNIINKWNAFSTNKIEKDIYEEYILKTFISNYNIKTTTFSIERVRIKSYIGEIEITINANQMMSNILNLLFEFAEFSGLGIKTSMGMGGIAKKDG
ncbi:MAG: CRISPR system precrRNA processing endoribonuclease RAMP protein Cas6 [Clostridia bacterium]|jgi:CRISPR-associated endoribonuclease Cas6|nr:CRISPR system precrRNA processing endoribonuclease RAMP protein Cas6 [Clostridia bacterium]